MLSSAAKKQEIIFVIGGPGSGKGTQCGILQKSKGYRHISAGDIIRKILNESTESKAESKDDMQHIRDAVKQGILLDDKMIIDIIKKEMAKYPNAAGFLIDGCPRTLEQVALFEREIKPCDKILYFDTIEKIMRDRMYHRLNIEKRADDNEKSIEKRLQIYREKTLPVVQHFETERAAFFYKINASGTMAEVAKQVRHAVADDSIKKIGILNFLKLYFTSGNYYSAVDKLEQQHGITNFEVGLSCATLFYIIQNREYVKKILSANTLLGPHYMNFNVSHHHPLNVLAQQAFAGKKGPEKNPLWRHIHTGLAKSLGDRELIQTLIGKHITKFFSKLVFDLDVAFEDFMLSFWTDYLFGDKVDSRQYQQTREKLLTAIRYTYYDSRVKAIPYLGKVACRFYGYLKGKQFKEVDRELLKFINDSDSGLMYRFKTYLEDATAFPQDKVNQTVLDNAFDFVLVFDFIHNAIYETLAFIVRHELDATDDRKSVYKNGLRNSFLFPYRSRVPQENIQLGNKTIKRNTTVYTNILETGFPHSYGPRSCIAVGVSNWIQEAIWNCLVNRTLRVTHTTRPEERMQLSHSLDVPISAERYQVRWSYPHNYLQRILPSYPFKGVDHFYDVLKTYENPDLVAYIALSFIETIESLKIPRAELCIVAPEVRGIPIASIVANALQVPFVMIRKPDKIPGRVLSKQYATAYSSDTVEISAESNVRKHVVLIDDGISSGGTTLACCHLVKRLGGNICAVLAMINHTYTKKPEELQEYNIQTLFDFKESTGRIESSLSSVVLADSKAEQGAVALRIT